MTPDLEGPGVKPREESVPAGRTEPAHVGQAAPPSRADIAGLCSPGRGRGWGWELCAGTKQPRLYGSSRRRRTLPQARSEQVRRNRSQPRRSGSLQATRCLPPSSQD